MGGDPAARAPPHARGRHHGVLRLRARRPAAQAGGDERAAARDGGDAQFRPVQPRPPHLCGAQARRHRAPVRPTVAQQTRRAPSPQRGEAERAARLVPCPPPGTSPAIPMWCAICTIMSRAGGLDPSERACESRRQGGSFMHCIRTFAAAVFSLALAGVAHAQDWPNRPITLVVPFAAGGGVDVSVRIQAQYIGEALGQTFVIENIGGAAGTTGSSRVAKAPPDGYTLLIGNTGTHAYSQSLYKKAPYAPLAD